MYIHRSGTHTRAVCSSCSTTWKVSDPPNRESLGFQVWVYLRICIHLCTYLSTILILHYTFREHLLTLDNLVFAISKSGFWYIPRVPPANIHQKKGKNDFKPFFEQRQGFPPPWDLHQIAAIQWSRHSRHVFAKSMECLGGSVWGGSSAWSPPWRQGAWYSLQSQGFAPPRDLHGSENTRQLP